VDSTRQWEDGQLQVSYTSNDNELATCSTCSINTLYDCEGCGNNEEEEMRHEREPQTVPSFTIGLMQTKLLNHSFIHTALGNVINRTLRTLNWGCFIWGGGHLHRYSSNLLFVYYFCTSKWKTYNFKLMMMMFSCVSDKFNAFL
jgi:hypothetical protein